MSVEERKDHDDDSDGEHACEENILSIKELIMSSKQSGKPTLIYGINYYCLS